MVGVPTGELVFERKDDEVGERKESERSSGGGAKDQT